MIQSLNSPSTFSREHNSFAIGPLLYVCATIILGRQHNSFAVGPLQCHSHSRSATQQFCDGTVASRQCHGHSRCYLETRKRTRPPAAVGRSALPVERRALGIAPHLHNTHIRHNTSHTHHTHITHTHTHTYTHTHTHTHTHTNTYVERIGRRR